MKSYRVTVEVEAAEPELLILSLVLFIILYKVALTFESVNVFPTV